ALMARLLTHLSPQRLNALAASMPGARRWANIGEKIHKGAGVMAAGSAEELYLGMVSQWRDPEALVIGSVGQQTLFTLPDSITDGLSDVERMMALDMLTYLPNDILTKVDRAAMGCSLETRVP
ncbi:asparagine synthetase B, partial [Pandoraea nosoerga]|nr:asparagine synthetase B [Pandoraea nosoerga]